MVGTNRARTRHPLAVRRAAVGMTQEQLAASLAVNRSTVLRWENGGEPSPRFRRPLANALGLSVLELADLLASASIRQAVGR